MKGKAHFEASTPNVATIWHLFRGKMNGGFVTKMESVIWLWAAAVCVCWPARLVENFGQLFLSASIHYDSQALSSDMSNIKQKGLHAQSTFYTIYIVK